MDFDIQILGSNSAMSSHGRHPSSQLLKIHQHTFLIDCGEGTQFQLQKFKCKPFKINCIFISHLHGDHYFGLIGLLTTFQLLRRESKLIIIGPPQLEDIIQLQLSVANSVLTFPIEFVPTQTEKQETVFESDDVVVTSFPLKHRIPCTGFLFKEKTFPRRINPDKIQNINLTADNYKDLRNGLDIVDIDGMEYSNDSLTLSGNPSRSYAYCTDTLYLPSIVPIIESVDLLYHETTFVHEAIDRAEMTFHSTTVQAATIARNAKVKKLLIGHFSSKYHDLSVLLEECKEVFDNTELSIEGNVIVVNRVNSAFK